MAIVTHLSQLDLNGRYSYADYLTWRLDETIELFRGKVSLISPAPSLDHQRIATRLTGILYAQFKRQACQLFAAPFDVRLYDRRKSVVANQDIFTVVQPDLCVICDTEKLDQRGCLGAPDWIIEILSKGNSKKEIQTKFELYRESGVKEYWIVYPFEQAVHQFVLDEEQDLYRLLNMFAGEDSASPYLFPDCTIDLQEVFAD
ncbi:Uma2 family endonuclease [Methylomonas sp. LL1]|uniref:Uma2 family endonuclease n=1 Tax=Methylomonas sp. LL1 TaxID=2785785 RepID=UPI0018C39CF6|nr:Uma2 family endonuclease [Methylomonas sp. LL1]QPK62166.1 Uma2 family endonuclease [Methylomonas sp. LL1]